MKRLLLCILVGILTFQCCNAVEKESPELVALSYLQDIYDGLIENAIERVSPQIVAESQFEVVKRYEEDEECSKANKERILKLFEKEKAAELMNISPVEFWSKFLSSYDLFEKEEGVELTLIGSVKKGSTDYVLIKKTQTYDDGSDAYDFLVIPVKKDGSRWYVTPEGKFTRFIVSEM